MKASNLLSKMTIEEPARLAVKGRTFSVQYNLPRLPVPALEQTLNRYLDTCRPLLDDEQFKTTSEVREPDEIRVCFPISLFYRSVISFYNLDIVKLYFFLYVFENSKSLQQFMMPTIFTFFLFKRNEKV